MDTSLDEALARALAGAVYDDPYGSDAGGAEDSGDSDYGDGEQQRNKRRKAGGEGRGRGRGRGSGRGRGRGRADPAAPAAGRPSSDGGAAAARPSTSAGAAPADPSADPSGGSGADADDADPDRSASGRRRRRDLGKQRQAGRAWTPEEEALFLKALELHGRDWKRGAELIGSRDHRAVASHAQKYLVRMCLTGQALPEEVARSGRGYTLGGALLDPYAAAARSYGFRPELLARLPPAELQQALSGLDLDRLPLMYGGRLPDEQAPVLPRRNASGGGAAGAGGEERARKPPRAPAAKKRRKGAASSGAEDDAADPTAVAATAAGPTAAAATAAAMAGAVAAAAAAAAGGGVGSSTPVHVVAAAASAAAAQAHLTAAAAAASGHLGLSAAPTPLPAGAGPPHAAASAVAASAQTEYSRNRPRRELAGQRAHVGDTSESLQLVKPHDFQGLPGSGAPMAQPFSVRVAAAAMLAMDFHAHLSSYEVIGLLGGEWHPAARQLVVAEAYACRRAEGSGAATSVELDAAAQVEAQAAMEARGQVCVGWYHSHPVFEPSPSQKDMDNQRNYQALFRCPATRLEPFLGVIVGPYDTAMPHPASVVTTFLVQSFKGVLVPYSVRYAIDGSGALLDAPLLAKLGGVLELFREDSGRIDFAETWRSFSHVRADGSLDGLPLSRLAKLRHSLRAHMREAHPAAAAAALDALCADIQARWGVDLAEALAAADGGAAAAAAAAAPTGVAVVAAAELGQPEPGGEAAAAAGAPERGGGGGGGEGGSVPAEVEVGAAPPVSAVAMAAGAGGAGPCEGSLVVEVVAAEDGAAPGARGGGGAAAEALPGAVVGPAAEVGGATALREGEARAEAGAEAARGSAGPGSAQRVPAQPMEEAQGLTGDGSPSFSGADVVAAVRAAVGGAEAKGLVAGPSARVPGAVGAGF